MAQRLTKDEYADLLAQIAGGGDVVGARARQERSDAEQRTFTEIHDNYWGLIFLGDAVHQFYADTLAAVFQATTAPLPAVREVILHWHIVSFGRFAAAFDLFARGYFFDAVTLARGLWETALTISALQQGAITTDELFGPRSGRSSTEPRVSAAELQRRYIEADRRIYTKLITNNLRLSAKGREAVEDFSRMANLATHKSRLHMAANLMRAQRGQGVPIYPQYEASHATAAGNIVYLATWALIATFSHFHVALVQTSPDWSARYDKTLTVFAEAVGLAPNPVVEGFRDVIATVFVIADATPDDV